jgi:hypothetical protein
MNAALIALGFIIAYTTHILKIKMKEDSGPAAILFCLILFKVLPLFLGVYLLLIGLGI